MKKLLKAVCTILMTLSVAVASAAEQDSIKRYQAVYVSKVAVEADTCRAKLNIPESLISTSYANEILALPFAS